MTAPSHEEVVGAPASCGFLDAEGIATERNPAAAHMQDESTDDEISGASDYGTLASAVFAHQHRRTSNIFRCPCAGIFLGACQHLG